LGHDAKCKSCDVSILSLVNEELAIDINTIVGVAAPQGNRTPHPHIRLYRFVCAALCVGVAYNLEYTRSFKDKQMLNEATIERRLITLEQTVDDLQRKIDSKLATESWLQKLTGSISDEAVSIIPC
jgi:hypothetical protein